MSEARQSKGNNRAPDKLINALRESDEFTRAKIIEELVSSPCKSMIEGVVRLLVEKNTSVRMDALDILKKTGNSCIEAIVQLLYHSNEDVRVYGCEVLGELKNNESLPHLIHKVKEDNENVRNAAVMALGGFDDPRVIDVLTEALHQEEWVAFSAIYSLAKIGNKRVVPALLEVFKTREEELSLAACEALIIFRDAKTIDEIVEFVDRVEEERKATFIRVIIDQADEQVFQKLVRRMGNELLDHLLNYLKTNKRKSKNVIRFLAHFQHKQSAHALLDILKDVDRDGEEYEEILHLFMDLKNVWFDDLEEYLREEDYVFPVIRACGYLGLTIPERILLTVFCSSPLDTKREIMKQLSRISKGNGNKIIREALKDSDGHVQADAVAIAGNLSLKELTSDILMLAKKGYPDVRVKALLALLRIDMPMAIAAIEWFVKEGTAEDKRTYLSVTSHIDAETNFPFLEELITSGDERVRQMAVRVVGNFVENEPYLELFETAFRAGNAPNEMLKVIGEKKLLSFKKPLLDLVQDPLQALWTRYHALSALGAFADRTLMPVFVNSLKEKDNLIKIGGLKALAELNDKRAVPHIRPYTKSADDDVKMAAMAALGKLTSSEAVC